MVYKLENYDLKKWGFLVAVFSYCDTNRARKCFVLHVFKAL